MLKKVEEEKMVVSKDYLVKLKLKDINKESIGAKYVFKEIDGYVRGIHKNSEIYEIPEDVYGKRFYVSDLDTDCKHKLERIGLFIAPCGIICIDGCYEKEFIKTGEIKKVSRWKYYKPVPEEQTVTVKKEEIEQLRTKIEDLNKEGKKLTERLNELLKLK